MFIMQYNTCNTIGEGKLGTNEEVFNKIMAHESYEQLRLVFEEYKNVSGRTLEQAIKDELGGPLHDAMMAVGEYIDKRLFVPLWLYVVFGWVF